MVLKKSCTTRIQCFLRVIRYMWVSQHERQISTTNTRIYFSDRNGVSSYNTVRKFLQHICPDTSQTHLESFDVYIVVPQASCAIHVYLMVPNPMSGHPSRVTNSNPNTVLDGALNKCADNTPISY